MWESICLTIAATAGNNIGKVLQKKGTLILPPLSFKLKVCVCVCVCFSTFFLAQGRCVCVFPHSFVRMVELDA